jgi:parallel beta-helix repeat protein
MQLRMGLALCLLFPALLAADQEPKKGRVIHLKPGPDAQREVQRALIRAKPDDVLELAAGTFEFNASLSLTVPNVTLRGQGMGKTILSFKKQDQGKEGLLVTADGFTAEDFTIVDSKGDGLKVNGARRVTFRRIEATWSEAAKETNGAYGLYPVQCKQVLIEECVASRASDAGIYVGQSQQIIIRRCQATENVAGIEVENSFDADVYDNEAVNNTGGILVFDLPDLPAKNGGRVRIFNNKVHANNHPNFAPKGNIVGTVPPGTGIMVMATDQVEVFKNKVQDHRTANLSVISYFMTQRPIQDKEYDPYPEGVYVHDNEFERGGYDPAGEMGMILAALLGKPLPDILYDGCVNPKKLVNGELPPELSLRLARNGSATFASLGYDRSPILQFMLRKPKIERDARRFEGEHPALKPVLLGSIP